MNFTKTSRNPRIALSAAPMAALLFAGIVTLESPAIAQVTSTPTTQKKPVRRSVLDLVNDAKKPREGEILPDATAPTPPAERVPGAPEEQPTPEKTTPAAEPDRKSTTGPKPTTKPTSTETKPVTTDKPAAPSSDQPAPTTKARETQRPLRAAPAIESTPTLSTSGTRFVAFDKARLHIVSQQGNKSLIQWRLPDDGNGKPGAWAAVPDNAEVTERREFRTGVGVSIDILIEDQATITVGPLSRVLFERRVRSDGSSLPGVTLARGEITIAENASGDVVVKTGTDSTLMRSGRVSFDGTEPSVSK